MTYPTFADLCIHYAHSVNKKVDTLTIHSDILFRYYLTKETLTQGLDELIVSGVDITHLLSKWEAGWLIDVEREILYLEFSKLSGKFTQIIGDVELHTYIKDSLDKLTSKFPINLGVTYDELNSFICEAIKTKNLKVLEFDGLLHVSIERHNYFSSSIDREVVIRDWMKDLQAYYSSKGNMEESVKPVTLTIKLESLKA